MISKTIVRNLVLLPLSFLTLFASAQILQFPPLEIALVYPSELPEEPPEKNVSSPGFVATHLAIDGAGWFVVSELVSGTRLLTRRGDFRLDSNNYLITANGYRVQGFNAANTTPIGQIGDIQIDHSLSPATTDPAATMTTFSVGANGMVQVWMSDGTGFTRAQILLQQINRPEHLQRIYPYLMLAEADAEPSPTLQPPGSAGLGTLESGTFSSEKFLFASTLRSSAYASSTNFSSSTASLFPIFEIVCWITPIALAKASCFIPCNSGKAQYSAQCVLFL